MTELEKELLPNLVFQFSFCPCKMSKEAQ